MTRSLSVEMRRAVSGELTRSDVHDAEVQCKCMMLRGDASASCDVQVHDADADVMPMCIMLRCNASA